VPQKLATSRHRNAPTLMGLLASQSLENRVVSGLSG